MWCMLYKCAVKCNKDCFNLSHSVPYLNALPVPCQERFRDDGKRCTALDVG